MNAHVAAMTLTTKNEVIFALLVLATNTTDFGHFSSVKLSLFSFKLWKGGGPRAGRRGVLPGDLPDYVTRESHVHQRS